MPRQITTDDQGRFLIRGVGRDRAIRLTVSGPTIQTKVIHALTRDVAPLDLTASPGNTYWGAFYGAPLRRTRPLPTMPVVGVVTDRDTGRLLSGVHIACFQLADESARLFLHEIEATTDRNGRYRLVGLPKGRGNHVLVLPGNEQPYVRRALEIAESHGLEPVNLDIGLKRGVLIEGRVTDKQTGEPLQADVMYNAFEDNPHLAAAPGYEEIVPDYVLRDRTGTDGTYRIVGLPGHGVISATFRGKGDGYLTRRGLRFLWSLTHRWEAPT